MRGDAPDHEPDDPQGTWDPQGLWQSQTKEYDAMTLADIRAKAHNFERRINRRNAVEYMACGVVLVGFGAQIPAAPNWMIRAGAGLVMLATVYIAWQLHRRGSVEATPEAGESLIDSYRRQLVRQRDAIGTVGSWYLAPFLPGMALMILGRWFRAPTKPGVTVEAAHFGLVVASAVCAAVFVGIWLLNLRGAKLLQKRIDDL